MDWRDYISSNPMICHGKARITGTRVMVTVILDNLADGLTAEDIMRSYPPVSRDAVEATLHYAAELARERVAPLTQRAARWPPTTGACRSTSMRFSR